MPLLPLSTFHEAAETNVASDCELDEIAKSYGLADRKGLLDHMVVFSAESEATG
ncbi:hypothetical protein [Bradyrhizobium sp. SUTN9-2]|uniref:hypothetical protein n=1 Tax=Bradyrhizobium sp. SUTN9-2 TaxID=1167456 RepID=UPI001304DC94|nr:hypothetical protein [Bradyrhizobium sp. SUTN9-2]